MSERFQIIERTYLNKNRFFLVLVFQRCFKKWVTAHVASSMEKAEEWLRSEEAKAI